MRIESITMRSFIDLLRNCLRIRDQLGFAFIFAPRGTYRQEYTFLLRANDSKIAHLREYFNPVRAAQAMNTPIRGLGS